MIDRLRNFIDRSVWRPNENERVGGVLTRFIRWRQRRKGIAILHTMPDYLLKDIGISRGEIEQVARGRCERLSLAQESAMSAELSTVRRRDRKGRGGSARRIEHTC